jgi:hypothetical protein
MDMSAAVASEIRDRKLPVVETIFATNTRFSPANAADEFLLKLEKRFSVNLSTYLCHDGSPQRITATHKYSFLCALVKQNRLN